MPGLFFILWHNPLLVDFHIFSGHKLLIFSLPYCFLKFAPNISLNNKYLWLMVEFPFMQMCTSGFLFNERIYGKLKNVSDLDSNVLY